MIFDSENIIVNLRTLTEKSTLGFGIYEDLKIGRLIKTNWKP